jgi:hypothetical protein
VRANPRVVSSNMRAICACVSPAPSYQPT